MANAKLEQIIIKQQCQIDPELYALLTYINRVKGIRTTSSCVGHHQGPCQIFCEADDISTLNKFIYDYFYGNSLWSFKMYVTDNTIDAKDWSKIQFIIESDPKYIEYPVVELMVSNQASVFMLKQADPIKHQLQLPIDRTRTLEDAIREVCTEEYQSVIEGEQPNE